jgi:3-methyladenine DNA glycosylase AlkD
MTALDNAAYMGYNAHGAICVERYDMEALVERLAAQGDPSYADFSLKLLPGVRQPALGVRLPALRGIAKEIVRGDWRGFLDAGAAHVLYEVRLLCAIVLGSAKCPADERIARLEAFLPQVDNWAVCDTLCSSLKPDAASREALFEYALECASSDIEFRKRFGLVLLMSRYHDAAHMQRVLEAYRRFEHSGYYARMGAAWGLATLWLYDRKGALSILNEGLWDTFTHNRAIQKLCESYRVSAADKALARGLRRREERP